MSIYFEVERLNMKLKERLVHGIAHDTTWSINYTCNSSVLSYN